MCSTATTTTDDGAQRGVGIVVIDQPQVFNVELAHFHGPNVVICKNVFDGKRTLLAGAYLPLSTLEHLPDLEGALTRFRDQEPILLGELNVEIKSQNPRSHQVADIMMEFGLLDLCHHPGMMSAPTRENMVSYAARQIVAGKM